MWCLYLSWIATFALICGASIFSGLVLFVLICGASIYSELVLFVLMYGASISSELVLFILRCGAFISSRLAFFALTDGSNTRTSLSCQLASARVTVHVRLHTWRDVTDACVLWTVKPEIVIFRNLPRVFILKTIYGDKNLSFFLFWNIIQLIRWQNISKLIRPLWDLNLQPTDHQSAIITNTLESQLWVADRKTFSNLQSCLTDSSWIHLILLIQLIQYKIGKIYISTRIPDFNSKLKNSHFCGREQESIPVGCVPPAFVVRGGKMSVPFWSHVLSRCVCL